MTLQLVLLPSLAHAINFFQEEVLIPKVQPQAVAAASSTRKERSVLQAKLTKLAIQIGYAGK